MAKQFSFSDLVGKLTESVDKEITILSDNEYANIPDWIHTGNYMLNAQISGSIWKGIPAGRIVQFAGESGTGKTFLTLNCVREAQKKGYKVIYIDTEYAIDEDMMETFGVDPKNVVLIQKNDIPEVKQIIGVIRKELDEKREKNYSIDKIMLVIDSLGQMITSKATEDAISGKIVRDMTKQQELKILFAQLTTLVGKYQMPCIITNHVYAMIGAYGNQTMASGGSGQKFSASVTLKFTKASDKDGDGRKMGIVVTSKPDKQRFALPIDIKFHISFIRGMNQFIGLQSYLDFHKHGVGPGKLEEEIRSEPLLDENGEQVVIRKKPQFKEIKTGNFTYTKDISGKEWAVKHLGTSVKISELFSEKVFTHELLERVGTTIEEIFAFPEAEDLESDLEGLYDDSNDSEEGDGKETIQDILDEEGVEV